jgi:PAS domain S-box-containing protein
VAAAILTLTATTRGVIDYAIESNPPFVVVIRGIQVALLLVLAGLASPRQDRRVLRDVAFAIALVVPLGNLMVAPFDLDETWPTILLTAVIVMGAALFVPWSWRRQATLATLLGVATLLTVLVWIPRTAFSWSDVALAAMLLIATCAASVVGSAMAERERRRLAESEGQYRALFETAGDGIAVLDEGGVIRQANNRLAELVGRPLADLVGRPFADLHATPGANADHVGALTGAPQRATHTFVHADGRTIDVDVTYARAGGAPRPLVEAIVRDLTERRALERREIKDQRANALEQLAGGMAHQFNNILGGILTHAALLRDELPDGRFATELNEILDAARRGRDLTTELRRFMRSEPLALKPTSAAALLESVAALARSSLPQTVAIDVQAATDLPLVSADADHLAHACLELVFNARDAMRGMEAGRLSLGAAPLRLAAPDGAWPDAVPGTYVRLSVGDTGHGMDAETRERIFEPFFTTKPMHRAAGIGLAKVYSVVRDHKGSVRVDSLPGRGTTVQLLLPATAAHAAAASPAPPPPAVSAEPATILIVDDEAIVRHSLRRALTRFGYRVLEAVDGPTALSALEQASPPVSLVILDLVLPGGGAGILELLRALRPDLKVLVSSGYSPEAETVKDLVRRVEGFLPKPYEMAELQAAVTKALAR